MNKNIVYNKTDSIEMDIFYETNGTNPSLKSVAKKKKKWKKWVLILLTLVFIVVLVYSLLKILFWFKDNMDMYLAIIGEKSIEEGLEGFEYLDKIELYDSGFALHVTDKRVNNGSSLKYLCNENGIDM